RTRPSSPPTSEKRCERGRDEDAPLRPRPARVLRTVARAPGRELRRPGGRRDGASRPERRRQDDDAAGDPRSRRPPRLGHARRRGADRPADAPDRPPQRRLRAGGPGRVRRAHRRREPAPRGARPRASLRPRLRHLPRARAARPPARGNPVGRPAADGRDRACAAERQPRAARRRAHKRAGAGARLGGRPRARTARRARDRPPRRAEPRRRATSRARRDRPRPGPRRAHGRCTRAARAAGARQAAAERRSPMSTFVLLTITGLGLGAMYFLIASGLSLIYGLMGVLNFAHGAFVTSGAYAAWWLADRMSGGTGVRLLLGALFGLAVGAVVAGAVELALIRPLYRRPVEQVLVTVGLALALAALVQGIWGQDARAFPMPSWLLRTTTVAGARIPNDRFLEIAAAAVVLAGLTAFLRYTRYGLVIRAGVENR